MTDSNALFDPRALAARLFSLRNAGKQAKTADFALPTDLRHAMDAQNMLAAEQAITSSAWKVAASPDGQAVAAPLHPYIEADSGAEIIWSDGMKFEAEIAIRLGTDLPIRDSGYSRAEVADAVATVHLGAELLVSAIQESGRACFLLFLADRLGNSGYITWSASAENAHRHGDRNATESHCQWPAGLRCPRAASEGRRAHLACRLRQ
ncbi:hypothetical protein EV130_102134 [Rhizobium azibense]|uniref:2-keto-4-pentenoate hydratase n=1 Tax=Rhizobium azibense TaxID=1136135 RepID=A0A4R3R4B1_9HYPH|nr:hypothetical protein EV130_102134 [Rhizobium azibense]